jgi:hypothetical protein
MSPRLPGLQKVGGEIKSIAESAYGDSQINSLIEAITDEK